MAYYHKIKNRWLPDGFRASRELTKLRPCEHMIDEAWRICKICANVWLCAVGVYANSREEMEDIESKALLKTYANLLYKVRTKTYRRDLSFYLNVRSCAWGAVGYIVHHQRFLKNRVRLVPIGRVEGSESDEGWLAGIASHTVPRLRTEGDCHAQASERLNENKRQRAIEAGGRTLEMYEKYHKASMKRLSGKYRDDAYLVYLADCEEFGIEPICKDDFVAINYEENQG